MKSDLQEQKMKLVEILGPHWVIIERDFEARAKEFNRLMRKDHELLGRVLKSHLIMEHYMDKFLSSHYSIENIDDLRLSFFQKAKMLPDLNAKAVFVKEGILELNAVRNKFGHELDVTIDQACLKSMGGVLRISREGQTFPHPVETIEAFTAVACTFLSTSTPEIEELFAKAFKQALEA